MAAALPATTVHILRHQTWHCRMLPNMVLVLVRLLGHARPSLNSAEWFPTGAPSPSLHLYLTAVLCVSLRMARCGWQSWQDCAGLMTCLQHPAEAGCVVIFSYRLQILHAEPNAGTATCLASLARRG